MRDANACTGSRAIGGYPAYYKVALHFNTTDTIDTTDTRFTEIALRSRGTL